MDIKKQITNIEFINTIKEMKKACICLAIIIIMSSITACGRAVPDEPKESMAQNQPESAAEAREPEAGEDEVGMETGEPNTGEDEVELETDGTDAEEDAAADLEETVEDRERSNGSINVSIERVDKSITDENGQVIAIVYYDKPVVSGSSGTVQKINAFFDEEEKIWFGGNGRLTHFTEGYYNEFLEGVELMQERWGNETLAEEPCRYAVDTRIAYLDDHLLSIFHVSNYRLEHNNFFFFGSTFDLDTGEVLPITELADISADDMREILDQVIYTEEDYYTQLEDENYEVAYYDRKIDMRYTYYYDGEALYIIDDLYTDYRNSVLIEWNGKLGKDCEASLHRYWLNSSDVLEEYHLE